MHQLKSRLLIQKNTGSALLVKGSRFFAVLLLIFVVSLNTPAVLAAASTQQTQNTRTAKKESTFFEKLFGAKSVSAKEKSVLGTSTQSGQAKKEPGFFQKLFAFLTAPFSAAGTNNNVASKKTNGTNGSKVAKSAVPTPKPTVKPTSVPTPAPTKAPAVTAPATTLNSAVIVKSLGKGVTFVDLIGKTVIDSFGNVYPAGSGKGTLGTTTNKYDALYLSNFSVDKAGKVTTVLGGGIVKSSSAGVLSSSTIDINSGDITGTLQAGNGGTGQTTFTTGDLLYGNSGNLSRLAVGSLNQMLVVTGGLPVWSSTLDMTSGTFGSLVVTGNTGMGTTVPNAKLSIQGNVGIGYTGVTQAIPHNGLAVFGNVGIGVTTANSKLAVAGNQVIGAGFAGMAATTNGLLVEGSVGIGISVPSQTFQIGTGSNSLVFTSAGRLGIGVTSPLNNLDVIGSAQIRTAGGASFAVTSSNRVGIGTTAPGATLSVSGSTSLGTFAGVAGPANGLAVSGNVGIGTTTASSALSVIGGGVFGANYGSLISPTSGLLVEGLVGIGNTAPGNTLAVSGGVNIGTYGTANGPSNGLAVSGNVGIGVTTPNALLVVNGGGVFGNGYSGMVSPTNGLLVQGLVGIGNTAPGNTLAVNGGLNLGTFASVTGPSNGLAVSGNIGIGVSTVNSNLAVAGNGVIGSGYAGMTAAANSLLVEGTLGIGTTAPGASLGVAGAGLFGASFANVLAPANGLAVQGNVGIGVSTANSLLTVNGGAVIGTGYNLTAPTNGLLVQGLVGIGNTAPGNTLAVNGGLNLGTFASVTGPSNGLAVSGNIGIGVSTVNSKLAVAGNGVVGAGYAGMTGPANGLLVEGNLGLGATAPADPLHLIGQFRIDRDTSITNQGCIRYGDNNQLQYSEDCVTYVNFSNIGVGSSVGGGWADSGVHVSLTNQNDNVGIGYSAAGTAKLAVNGNVGVGTTAPLSAFSVIGGGVFGANYGTLTAPANGLLIEGLVGIGTTAPGAALGVAGAGLFGASYANALAPANGLAIQGNVGIGVSTANSLLTVNGGAVIGTGYNLTAPTNGLLVQGLVGIGNTAPGNTLAVNGGLNLGTFASVTGPSNGLAVSGNIGIGVSTVNSKLAVAGNGVVGAGYAGMTGPANGLLVEGRLGVGTSTPSSALSVSGGATFGTFANLVGPSNGIAVSGNVGLGATGPRAQLEVVGNGSVAAMFLQGTVGIGNTAPGNTLAVNGGVNIGTYGSANGPANGLAVSGNVGIGTTTPIAPLDVMGSSNVAAIFRNGNVGIGTTVTNATLTVGGSVGIGFTGTAAWSAPANGLIVAGSVGIGTSDPHASYKLDVAGAVRATGGFNGTCRTDGTVANGPLCNQDVAEVYDSSEAVEPGDVLAIDPTGERLVKKSTGAYDRNLIGVVSTMPGLILGINGSEVYMGGESSNYGKNADPKKPAVVLTGKVPVKASTENGAIKAGDYVTASSIAGVAMKATKAGPVIGQALSGYDGEGVGVVHVYARLAYFNGAALEDNVADLSSESGLDAAADGAEAVEFAQNVLVRLLSEQPGIVGAMSDITTDRVAAGIEIITPKLTADTIILRSLEPLAGKDMTLTLGNDQKFVIQSKENETAITFDNQGNAYFKGEVVATAIYADQIKGLKVMTNELVASQVSALDAAIKSVKQASTSAQAVAGTSIDTSTLAKLGADGGLTVSGPAEFKAVSIFNALADFIAGVVFRGDVSFLGRPTFNKDTAGLAIIGTGADSVRVNFEKAYAQTPFVNVTVTNADDAAQAQVLSGEIRYVVADLSSSGFTVKINKAAPGAIRFSWTAIAVSNSAVSSSTGPAAASSPAPTAAPTTAPTAAPAPSEAPVSSPAPTVVPTAAPTPTAVPTATPAPTVEPSATQAPTTAPSATPAATPAQ